MLRIEIHTSLRNQTDPIAHAMRHYHIKESDVRSASIWRRSLDARPHREACYVDLIDFELDHEEQYLKKIKGARRMEKYVYHLPECGPEPMVHRPVVVGFGPAGMAAGLALAARGYRPLIIERGARIDERQKDVRTYWQGGSINPESNVQYGEGGAGAFSDGKLTTRVKDPRVHLILEELIKAGADPSIAWTNHPHLGTDALAAIDEAIRQRIEEMGGEVRFHTRLDDIRIRKGQVTSVLLSSGEEIPTETVILAIGHSARDTMHMLASKEDLILQPKNFAVGVRVEHLQSFINHQQYRTIPDDIPMPAAEYHLSHTSSLGKGVYSFCMCPGGYVVDGASCADTVVTNGMSYAARNGRLANSAIVVQVDSSDFGGGLFDGMTFQQNLEENAWKLGHGRAPAQLIEDYCQNRVSTSLKGIQPTFPRGTALTDLHALFSPAVNRSLEEFFAYMDRTWPGFTSEGATMTGVETRTSSPIRIVRNLKTLESDVQGLWPAGEGAGFAGGIVSSAIDGLKCAEEIIRRYSPVPSIS
jgi:uncharacterized FAD-dependent dehydrogenase